MGNFTEELNLNSESFDSHIDKSIKGYSDLMADIEAIADRYIMDTSHVYDLGCSTGKFIQRLANKWVKDEGYCPRFVGIDSDKNWKVNKSDKFLRSVNDLYKCTYKEASFISSIFTLQFIEKYKRQKIIDEVYAGLLDGGAFVMCEKVKSEHAEFQEMNTFALYDHKVKSFTEKEILDKERTLRRIMRPTTLEDNLNMLRQAGFKNIEVFWRQYNFVAIIATK